MSLETQQTLAIIKPDAFSFRLCGAIIGEIEKSDLDIVGARVLRMSVNDASRFYAVHKERPFYKKLIGFMTSGPVMVLALHGVDAIAQWRQIIGNTNPDEAAEGTIRKMFASDTTFNAVHGSDSPETAKMELDFFFRHQELVRA